MMDYDGNSIDADLCKPKSQFDKTVKRHAMTWLESYKRHEDVALASLITLIFRACKCPFRVNGIKPEDLSWAQHLQELEDEMENFDPDAAPILETTEEKGFSNAKNLCNLIGQILVESGDVILNEYFYDNILQVLDALSKSGFRNFRHGSTLIALRMVTTLSDLMKLLMSQLKACHKQLSVEQAKTTERRSSERIENLSTTCAALDSDSNLILEQIDILRKHILPPRFRDVCVEIRLICLTELEVWIKNHNKVFLKPNVLEYLRQFLCDSKSTIVAGALKVVKWIFSNCEFAEMEPFTLAIEGSIVKLSMNCSQQVSSLAIQVTSSVVEKRGDLIPESSKEFIKYLVYSPQRQVSNKAGEFLHQTIISDLKEQNENHPKFPMLFLLRLVDFIIKSDGTEKVALLVEAMLSLKNNYLTAWKSYIVLLLLDEFLMEAPHHLQGLIGEENLSLNSKEEGIIISLMLNSLKQVFTQESPRKEKRAKSQKTLKRRAQRNDSEEVAEYFLAFLPKVMKKFMPEKSKIVDLSSVYLTLNYRHCQRREDIKNFGEVFKQLPEKHTDIEVHFTCAKVLSSLCEGNTLFVLDVLEPFLEQITNKWMESLRLYGSVCSEKQLSLSPQNLESNKRDVIFSFVNNSSLLFAFGSYFPLDEYVGLDQLFILSKGRIAEHCTAPIQVMEYSFKTAHAIILREATERKTDNKVLKDHVEEFCAVGGQLLQGDFKYSVRHSAYMCLSENVYMLRSLMPISPSWITDCWKAVTVNIVKYFSAMACEKDEIDYLSRKEEENFITVYLSLIKRRVLPQEAVVYVLMHHDKKIITLFTNIVKETLSIVQSWGMEEFALHMLQALSLRYEEILYCDETGNAKKNQLFEELQQLAALLMKVYGDNLAQHRKSALKFHLSGIDFATEIRECFVNPLFGVHFALILIIFAPIIHPNDKRKLISHLDQQMKEVKRVTTPDPSSLDVLQIYEKNFTSEPSSYKNNRKRLPLRRNLLEEMNMDSSMENDTM